MKRPNTETLTLHLRGVRATTDDDGVVTIEIPNVKTTKVDLRPMQDSLDGYLEPEQIDAITWRIHKYARMNALERHIQ